MQLHLNGENFLLGISRIALTFVGFTSIISLMRHRKTEWLPQEIRGLKLMFELDLAVTLFALFPFPVFYLLGDTREQMVWRISELLLAVYLANATIRQNRKYWTCEPSGRHPFMFVWTFTYPMMMASLLQIYGALRFPTLGLYSCGLFGLLVPPIVQFSIFIAHFGIA